MTQNVKARQPGSLLAYATDSIAKYRTNTVATSANELEQHVASTYSELRRGMAVLAWMFPFVLWWIGNVFGIKLRDSMSAYYYGSSEKETPDLWPALFYLLIFGIVSYLVWRVLSAYIRSGRIAISRDEVRTTSLAILGVSACYLAAVLLLQATGTFEVMSTYVPMRTVFIGFLCATGSFLFLYKGFTQLENVLLNFAGLGAILVALFPTTNPECGQGVRTAQSGAATVECSTFHPQFLGVDITWMSWHGIFAAMFFIGGALAIFLCANKTLDAKLPWASTSGISEASRSRYRRFYLLTGILMLLSPALAWFVTRTAGGGHFTFWLELGGMLAFAAYWWVKSDEIKQSGADRWGTHAGAPWIPPASS